MNPTKSSKRQRISEAGEVSDPSGPSDANDTRLFYTLLEALEARVWALEQKSTTRAEQTTQKSISDLMIALGGRITKLEHKSQYYFLPQKKKGSWDCPADSCNRRYKRLDRYHEHIRAAGGYGHAIL